MHVDLFEDHLTFGVEVRLADHAVLQHVREVIDGHLEVAVQHARVVARVLLAGERVDIAAHGVEVLRDLLGGAPLRALEEQVLQEMAGRR